MSIEAEAVYENGTLKFDHALPLEEHQRVRVSIETDLVNCVARRIYGIIGWKGDSETIQKIALQPEHGELESP